MDRGEILRTAESLVNGDRARQHGDHRVTYTHVAESWRWWIHAKYGFDIPLDHNDALQMMALLKMARSIGSDNPDNFVDACGYVALVGEG